MLQSLRKSSSPKPVPNIRQSATNHYQQQPNHPFLSLGHSRSPLDIGNSVSKSGNLIIGNKSQQRVLTAYERCNSPVPLYTVRFEKIVVRYRLEIETKFEIILYIFHLELT